MMETILQSAGMAIVLTVLNTCFSALAGWLLGKEKAGWWTRLPFLVLAVVVACLSTWSSNKSQAQLLEKQDALNTEQGLLVSAQKEIGARQRALLEMALLPEAAEKVVFRETRRHREYLARLEQLERKSLENWDPAIAEWKLILEQMRDQVHGAVERPSAANDEDAHESGGACALQILERDWLKAAQCLESELKLELAVETSEIRSELRLRDVCDHVDIWYQQAEAGESSDTHVEALRKMLKVRYDSVESLVFKRVRQAIATRVVRESQPDA